jgi:CRISPR-associated endoribonuclease Cas6
MRLHLKLTPNTEPIDFNYQHKLTGVLHKWLGQNELHDKISLYSFSWLRGYVATSNDGLFFPKGAHWFISFWEKEYGKDLIQGIVSEPDLFKGLKVDKVQVKDEPDFDNVDHFRVASPVLVRKVRDDKTREHLSYNKEEADPLLKRTLNTRIKAAGLDVGDFDIGFDRSYQGARTKLVHYKNNKLVSSLCPIKVKGSPELKRFLWTVGAGELTGSGFGAIC